MRIVEGKNVDLISPFPIGEVKRTYGWNHCYRTLTETDDSPKGEEAFLEYMKNVIETAPSWGIVDKNHLTNSKHEAPLVGVIVFEPVTLRNGYLHLATARKAWRTGLIDEAGQLIIGELFKELPTLTRLGVWIVEKNFPAKALCKRLGFKYEGLCEDMVVVDEKPESVIYFGLTRRRYNECLLPLSYQQSPVLLEESQVESEERPQDKSLLQPSQDIGDSSDRD